MKALKEMRQYLAEGLQREKSGSLPEAAMFYEKVVDGDPSNQEAVGRLLIIYRKLKEFRKELAVIDNAIGAYKEQDKTIQENWLRSHPGAAGAGKAMLRSMGGGAVTTFGTNPVVNRLLQRRELVKRKIEGGIAKRKSTRTSSGTSAGKREAAGQVPKKKNKQVPSGGSKKLTRITGTRQEKQEALKRLRKAAEQRKQEALKRQRKAAEQRKQEAKAEREAAAAARKEATKFRRQQEKEEKHPSLFVISLRYLVPLEQIDAEMHRHVAFLDKYYKSGHILISGRQVPRTGGVIIARAKDRAAAERMLKEDPFVRKKLASIDIVEFSASRIGKGLNLLLKGTSKKPLIEK